MTRPTPLTAEEERSLAGRVAARDRAARDELVFRHRWMVDRAAMRRRDRDDAIGDGLVALIRFANQYRADDGRFEDGARRAIDAAVRGRRGRKMRRWSLDEIPPERLAARPSERHADEAVTAAIATDLTERQRAAVRSRHGLDGRRKLAILRSGDLESAERVIRERITKGA